MNNVNIAELMKLISTMDKSQLEQGLSQASKILNNPQADSLIHEIKNKQIQTNKKNDTNN